MTKQTKSATNNRNQINQAQANTTSPSEGLAHGSANKAAKALKASAPTATVRAKRATKPSAGARTRRASGANKVFDTVIIGAGFGGLGTAIELKKAGVTNFVILERASEVGGTWRDNQYPGAACDIPSNLYSYSFAPNPAWSSSYSGSSEILDYIHGLVKTNRLGRFIRFQQTVAQAKLDEQEGVWVVTTEEGVEWKGRTVVMASGALANASFPDIRGIDTFKGKKLHSARWDHDYDLTGKRVAVVGTGASAIQIIPEIADKVASLKVFQRTPAWVVPRLDFKRPGWVKRLFGSLPSTQKLAREGLFWAHEAMALAVIWDSPLRKVAQRLAKSHLRFQVKDRWLRRQLTPDFKIGCKRVLVSNDYYPALQKPNVELITWPIAGISETGIRTAEGLIHEFDAIVFATGFDIPKQGTPYPVIGTEGRVLAEEWRGGAKAYKSINISGYPNLYMIFGPNSGPGHNSALVYMEHQIGYAVQGIHTILNDDIKLLDVKASAQEKYNRDIQKRLAKTNWNSGCKSWYLTEDGYNATMYPGFATQYGSQMSTLNLRDYQCVMTSVSQ